MELSKTLDQQAVVRDVKTLLHEFCLAKIEKSKDYDSSYTFMWESIDSYLIAGGKRIRPYLTMLAYSAYGGDDVQKVYPAAGAWELLHAGLLVHDDIIDRDTMRHGTLNIAGTYLKKYGAVTEDSAHFAGASALLAGDLLLAGAHELVLHSELSPQQKIQSSIYLSDALYTVGGGELLDVESILKTIESSSPKKIALFKTAGYSFEFPLMNGAYLAGAPESELALLQQFGQNTGIAFQIIDDILGIFGNTTATGKPNDSDIREKKRTAVIMATLSNLKAHDKTRLEQLFEYTHQLTSSEVAEVRAYIQSSGALTVVTEEAKLYAQNASEIIKKLTISGPYKQELHALVEKLLVRLA